MVSLSRRNWVAGALTLSALCAAGGAGAQVAASADDMAIGAADAPVTLLEYGSVMCSHCRAFETASWDALKREYIDTGRVRFIFREALAPVSPDGSGVIESITLAMYQVARCQSTTPDQYFTRLSGLFERQPAIFHAESMGAVRDLLITAGLEAGVTREQALACMNDPTAADRMRRLSAAFNRDGGAAGIAPERMGTPMFFLDGRHIDTAPLMSPEGLRRILDAALAAAG